MPLRHYFALLDGGTSGPQSYCGPIGQKITSTELNLLPIINFEKIPTILPKINRKNLSKDQQVLFDDWKRSSCPLAKFGKFHSEIIYFGRKPFNRTEIVGVFHNKGIYCFFSLEFILKSFIPFSSRFTHQRFFLLNLNPKFTMLLDIFSIFSWNVKKYFQMMNLKLFLE